MDKSEEIRALLKQLTAGAVQTFPAVVVSVDLSDHTAIVLVSDLEMKVRLKSAINDTPAGFLIVPKVGTSVLVALILNDPDTAYICAVDEVESVQIRASSLVINDGDLGGMVIIQALVDKINRLEERFNTHTHIGVVTGPSASGIPDPASIITPLTQVTDLENDKVKH